MVAISMEMREIRENHGNSDPSSSDSATTTAVNSPATSQFPPGAQTTDAQTATSSDSSSSSDNDDDEADVSPDSIQGWPQLAQFMAQTPDLAAFPRFRDLQVKSLLYYQCELQVLRRKLHILEYKDNAKGERYNEWADDLMRHGNKSKQFKLVEQIRGVLKKYNKALLQYSQICALPEPEPFNMRTLRRWLVDPDCAFSHVRDYNGAVKTTWGNLVKNPDDEEKGLWSQFGSVVWSLFWPKKTSRSNNNPDLALTKPLTKVDGLTHWWASQLVPFSKALKRNWNSKEKRHSKKKPQDIEENADNEASSVSSRAPFESKVKKGETLEYWSGDSALRLTSFFSTIVACLLPVIAISVLSQVHGTRNLLLCLAGFSLVFALGLIAMTQGTSKRTEVFAATAAFSAVMVVFISNPPAPVIMMPPGSAIPSVSPGAVISALPRG